MCRPVANRCQLFALLGLAVFAVAGPAARAEADMTVVGYDPALHDRYSNNNGAFIGLPFDWTGVGKGTGWATLISETYFITSWHARPLAGDPITFHTDNSSAPATALTYDVASITRIGTTDLAVGRLVVPLNGSISSSLDRYPILLFNTLAEYENLPIYMVGQVGLTGQRVGTNTIEPIPDPASPVFLADVGGVLGVTYYSDFDSGTQDEARVEAGDSGGPTFGVVGGQLALVGIHWAQTGNPSGSLDTFVPWYVNEIAAIVNAGGESISVVGVPEPATWALAALSLASGAMWVRKRRRTAASARAAYSAA